MSHDTESQQVFFLNSLKTRISQNKTHDENELLEPWLVKSTNFNRTNDTCNPDL